MKNSVLIFLNIIIISIANAQLNTNDNKGYKYNNAFDVAFSAGNKQSLVALSWAHLHPITKNKKFKIGYGVRFNSFSGKNLNYVTAPAILTTGKRGPQAMFSEVIPGNYDTINVSKANINALNLSINLQYTFKNKLDVAFSIDAAGFSFGKKVNSKYIAYQSSQNNTTQMAKPTPLNLLLIGDNDIGTINSEIFLRYWFKPNWAIKAGASFLFTEYTTDNKLRLNNDRFRNKTLLGMISISYRPF